MTTTWFQNLKKQAGKLKDVVASGNIQTSLDQALSPLRGGMILTGSHKRQQADQAVYPLLELLFASSQPPWLVGRLSALNVANGKQDAIFTEDNEAADEQEEIRKALINLSDLASIRENHEVIGRHLPDMFRWLRALITSRGGEDNSNPLLSSNSDKETLHLLLQMLHAIILFDKNGDNRTNNYVELVNTEAFFAVENKDGDISIDNISVLFDLLSETSFHVRYESLKILQTLIANGKLSQLQERVLQARTGIPRLMDLFLEEREAIRNELLLLLIELTQHQNSELQKIIAFQGCFERIFEIIEAEIQASDGENRGSIVIADCLQLMRNLLFSNLSNQNYFSETGCLSRLVPLLELTGQSDVWILTDDQINVLILALDVVSILVSNKPTPTSSSLPTSISSNSLSSSGVSAHWASTLLKLVSILALSGINAPSVRAKALYTLGSLLRGNPANTSALPSISISPSGVLSISSATSLAAKVSTKTQSPTALFRLLTIALHSSEISERTAAVSAFGSYLYRNPEGQIYLASTLNPPPSSIRADGGITAPVEGDDDNNQPIGSRICKAILTGDFLQSWFASTILCDMLSSNSVCKELALHIPIYYSGKDVKDTPIKENTLMHRVLQLLVQSRSYNEDPIKVGLIRLLCIWFDDCPKAVKVFRESSNYIPLLVELINQQPGSAVPVPSYSPVKVASSDSVSLHLQGLCSLLLGLCLVQTLNSEEEDSEKNAASLQNIIIHRIGKEKFVQRLDSVRKSASFVSAEQDKPVETLDSVAETLEMMYYNYDFTILFKEIYGQVIQLLKLPPGTKPPSLASSRQSTVPVNSESCQDLVVQSYKNIIRDQDITINQLRKQLAEGGNGSVVHFLASKQEQIPQQLPSDVLSKLLQLAESLFASYSELGAITLAKHEEVELAKSSSPEICAVVQAEATRLQNLFDTLQLSISQVQALISLPSGQPETQTMLSPTPVAVTPLVPPSLVLPAQPTLSPPRTPSPNHSQSNRASRTPSTPSPLEQKVSIQAPQPIYSVASLFSSPPTLTASPSLQSPVFEPPSPSYSPAQPSDSSSNTFDVAALLSGGAFDVSSLGSQNQNPSSPSTTTPSFSSNSFASSPPTSTTFDVSSLFGPPQSNNGPFNQPHIAIPSASVLSPSPTITPPTSISAPLTPNPSSANESLLTSQLDNELAETLRIYEDVLSKSLVANSFDAAVSSLNAFVEWSKERATTRSPLTFPNAAKYAGIICEKLKPFSTRLSTLEENSDNTLSCCKLLSLLGYEDEALQIYRTYIEAIVCKEVLLSSDYDFSTNDDFEIWSDFLAHCSGDSSVTVLSQLFDSIAGNIDEQRSLAEEKLFSGTSSSSSSSFATIIRQVKSWSDTSATTLTTNFISQHQVLEAVVAVKQRQQLGAQQTALSHPSIQDSRVLQQLLEKMTIISRCSRIYEQFITRKLAENEPGTPIATIQGQVNVPVSIQELIFHYIALEEYFIIDSTSRALQIPDISPDSQSFLMVDHVFFILQRALSRSFSTARINGVSNIVNLINNHLSIDFRDALQRLVLQYSSVASPAAEDMSRKWIDFNKLPNHAAALNSVETSIGYLSNIHQYIEEHCAKSFFDVKPQVEKIKISSDQLKNETLRIFKGLLQSELSTLASALVHSHLQPLLQSLVSTNYILTEAQYAEYEVNDPFAGQFLNHVQNHLAQFRQSMNEQVIGTFLSLVVKEVVVILEQAVLQKRFNLLGGVQWSKDLLAISTFFTTLENIDTAVVAVSLQRLNQISTLLTFEKASDVESMRKWTLGVNEIRMVLSHRVEFTGEEIARLKLTSTN